ncbi:MAG TPA: hypothetical protein DEF51_33625 [Myxococcales bacterium]|nr:hypothetical protein [Myxococcales bacterium]
MGSAPYRYVPRATGPVGGPASLVIPESLPIPASRSPESLARPESRSPESRSPESMATPESRRPESRTMPESRLNPESRGGVAASTPFGFTHCPISEQISPSAQSKSAAQSRSHRPNAQ